MTTRVNEDRRVSATIIVTFTTIITTTPTMDELVDFLSLSFAFKKNYLPDISLKFLFGSCVDEDATDETVVTGKDVDNDGERPVFSGVKFINDKDEVTNGEVTMGGKPLGTALEGSHILGLESMPELIHYGAESVMRSSKGRAGQRLGGQNTARTDH